MLHPHNLLGLGRERGGGSRTVTHSLGESSKSYLEVKIVKEIIYLNIEYSWVVHWLFMCCPCDIH